jgi:hypothetical protein
MTKQQKLEINMAWLTLSHNLKGSSRQKKYALDLLDSEWRFFCEQGKTHDELIAWINAIGTDCGKIIQDLR